MIGVVIFTHAQMGTSLLDAVRMIIGPVAGAAAVAVRREAGIEEMRHELTKALTEVGADVHGAIIMTDMMGGSPSNISTGFLAPGRIEIISGVNLPMLLKFFSSRANLPVAGLALVLRDYGQQGIVLASDLLQQGRS